jgi:hypothetical protein
MIVCEAAIARRDEELTLQMLCRSGAHGGSGVVGQWRRSWKELAIWCALALLAAVWTLRAHETHKHTLVRPIRAGERIRWAARYLAAADSEGRFKYLARANGLGVILSCVCLLSCHAFSVSLGQSLDRSLQASFSFSLHTTLFCSGRG